MKITAETKARMATALVTLAVNVPVSVLTSYCTIRFTAVETARAQRAEEEREQEYVESLQEAVGAEAEQNARNIQRWLPRLVNIARDLESFVNDKDASRPGVNPGYGMLTETTLSEAVESRVATRYLPWCVLSALNGVRNRLSEGNAVKREVDAALADYTATLPGPPAEAYTAAALLHARIEELVGIYAPMPRLLGLLRSLVAMEDCSAEIVLPPAESG